MTKCILFMMLFICSLTNAQQKKSNHSQQNRTPVSYPKLIFSYDSEGNQIERKFEWSYTAKSSNPKGTVITEIKADNLEEILSSEVITYYPNPVKDELYLKWELIEGNAVASINIFDLNGHLLQSYFNGTRVNYQTISFSNYPSGVYAVVLLYSNGKQKSIKIIKQ